MKDNKFTVVSVALVALILGILYTLYFVQWQSRPEVDIETYVRSKLTQEDVAPGLVPAAIYYRRPDMSKEQFCCVGTLCPDSKGNPQIITAEHIFRTDIRSNQIMSVRALRGIMEPLWHTSGVSSRRGRSSAAARRETSSLRRSIFIPPSSSRILTSCIAR